MSNTSITLRSVPTQARSRETFERILEAAVELLEEEGWDGFNTNLLAQKADCRVSAVYRYFSNKETVIATLARRAIDEWDTWFENFDAEMEATGDLAQVWSKHVDKFYNSIHQLPGGLAIRRAMKASPLLAEIDQADTDVLIQKLADTLRTNFPQLKPRRCEAIAQVLLESAVAVLDKALESTPAKAKILLEELKTMQQEYLKLCTT